MNKHLVKTGFKIIIAAGLLGWFLSKSDISKIFESFSNLSINFLLAAIGFDFIYLIIKSFRWRLLLPQYTLVKLLQLSFISQFYSVFSAGQFVGEAAKIYILGKGQKESGQIAMSVLIDKVTGIIGVIGVAILGLIFTKTVLPKSLILIFPILAAACLISIFLIKLPLVYNLLIKFFTNWLNRSIRLKKPVGLLIRLIEAWHIYSKKTKVIFLAVILSVIFQLVAVSFYLTLSYGFGVKVSFFDWCWVLGVLSGLLVLPITIGGIGLREGSLVGLLGFFSIAPEKALALSFAIFGIQLIFAVIGGIFEIQRTKMFRIKMVNNN
jgi:hypothetical protein